MRPNRRRFLGLTLAAGIIAHVRGLLASMVKPSAPGVPAFAALAPYLDTLIPADESPAASALGVDRRLIDKAAGDAGYRRLLAQGCRWLDRAARKLGAADFAALPEGGREAVVALFAAARRGSRPRIFFETTRSDAFFHYYARPESWAGLGYDGPPQPVGFPDHAAPPGGAG